MSRVLVTGAAGFIGRRLTLELLKNGSLAGRDGTLKPIDEVVLLDRSGIDVTDIGKKHPKTKLTPMLGDISNPTFLRQLCQQEFHSVFHLAASLTLDAEKDPNQAWLTNVEPLRLLLDQSTACPRVVFASSIAVFGGKLPERVTDDIAHAPKTSYGMHKAVCELLIADYSRHGSIDGRSLRLPIVVTRTGPAVPVVSDNIAAIIREPLEGRSVTAPLSPDTVIPIASVGSVVSNLIKLHNLRAAELPENRVMNLPSLSVTIQALVDAVTRSVKRRNIASIGASIPFQQNPALQAIVDSWPKVFVSSIADDLGLGADADLDCVIDDYVRNRVADKKNGITV